MINEIQAIQALSSEEYIYEFGSIKRHIRFCDRINITNFTFEEFTLLFGLKFCGNVSVPIKLIGCCADGLVTHAWSLLLYPISSKVEVCNQVLSKANSMTHILSTSMQAVNSFPRSTCTVALMRLLFDGSVFLSDTAVSFENFQLHLTNSEQIKSKIHEKCNDGFCQQFALLRAEVLKKLVDALLNHTTDQANTFLSRSELMSKASAENLATDFYFILAVVDYLIVAKSPEHFQSLKVGCGKIRMILDTFVDTLSIDTVSENASQYANKFELGSALLNPFTPSCSSKDNNSSDFVSYFANNSYHVGHFEQLPLPLHDL